ncbi:hypothetical protein CBS101457_001545 [Exobasidium rhododendri]|nr:hypothetical protein CBS101457_001545 [Exobasidium rhododendri]
MVRPVRSTRSRASMNEGPIIIKDDDLDDDDTPSPFKSHEHSGVTSGLNTPATSISEGDTSKVSARSSALFLEMDRCLDGGSDVVPSSKLSNGRVAKREDDEGEDAESPPLKRKRLATKTLVAKKQEAEEKDEREDTLPIKRTSRVNRRVKREQDSIDPEEKKTILEDSIVHLGGASDSKTTSRGKGKGKVRNVVKEEAVARLPPLKNKGKGKAVEAETSFNYEDFAMDTDDELAAVRKVEGTAEKYNDEAEESDIQDVDSAFSELSEESLSDWEESNTRAPRRQKRRPAGVSFLESDISSFDEAESDGESDGSSATEDVPLAQLAGSSAGGAAAEAAHGSMQEDAQYETAKQRAKRIKRELREQRANARAGRTGRARRVKKKSQYEKNKDVLVSHHPELKSVWENLRATPSQSFIKADQPVGLSIKLLPFQLEGLNWLIKQEKSIWKGGALADEMGMGKTIQIISLLLSDRKKPNLVIAPTVAILQWRNEIEKYTEGFKVIVWHGANRSSDTEELRKADVVLASYGVLESSFRKQVSGFKRKGNLVKEKSAIHSIAWHRVVLDEAHNIKERSTNTAKGAFELKSSFRWCLSGTPLQNRVGELYSMIRFLGGDPFAFYYCKRCPCKSLHWQFKDRRTCDKCGHTPMHHTCYWNNEILKPIQKFGTTLGEGKDAFERLRLLLDRVMLRRTKLERADDMGLPPRTVVVRRDMFNEEEEDLYESLYSATTRKFSTYLDQGTVLNNYSNIFTLLTRMRQLACHPDLVLRSKTGITANLLGNDQGSIHVCRICQDEAEDAIMSKCRHIFCRECVRQWVGDGIVEAGETAPECPYCHATLTIDLEGETLEPARGGQESGRQGILSKLDMNKWRSSSKIEALLEELNQVKSEDKTIKSLVFSQFVNFLDLIAFRLTRAGFTICRLEGNMSPEARNKTINHFMNNPGVTVFLVSLKAGGVALNLTEASRVFLMDPAWNPSVETQAMDRIHRLGQHRPIVVKRFVIENSIEDRIIDLQYKKLAMIEAAIGKDDSAMGRLSVSDMNFLFRL